MKATIWITNLEGKHFEVSNSVKSVIDINGNDIIQYDARPGLAESTLKIIHKGKNREETEYILNYIRTKIKEKSELQLQRRAVKKIEGTSMQQIVDNLDRELRNDYFEINLNTILVNKDV